MPVPPSYSVEAPAPKETLDVLVASTESPEPLPIFLQEGAPNLPGLSDRTWWSWAFDRFGLPIILLFIGGWGVWRVARWARPHADRLMGGILDYNDKAREVLEEQNAAFKLVAERLATQTEALGELARAVSESTSARQTWASEVMRASQETTQLLERVLAEMQDARRRDHT